ncbi:MAG: hypothetical protein E7E54_04710 [Varibaculum cambriense]|uniref:hypothetical protein n=1 Tax=Varibaculum cambriense TaxID=184870 RepID=UPI0028FFC825|nr:hypothetical protein [Varibaculum cambriense]MDU1684013.1 hypothetical protein [Varibaculum cambriense]MDU2150582.1 hypothetical protein [Varibaculum cambriense]MDU7412976.1 hypothetical protein [Varibaculum cambriense]
MGKDYHPPIRQLCDTHFLGGKAAAGDSKKSEKNTDNSKLAIGNIIDKEATATWLLK